tara:strand:- start:538 stop:789 length:252 start_codon:yes stop_codon:yes gene_type:complete
MSWEDTIKKRKSKRVIAHNKNISDKILFYENLLKDKRETLSIQGTSKMLSAFGREYQMKRIKRIQREIKRIENKLDELKDKLK